ncbi:hypothetical protein GGTG_10653 [Gaeumannomyces tritici R3-111a-1]|uniref:Uncharacterized protein n=1 Tax=Gaeumannomyces tritici (strain R3-111a-1) TaxID=644352 RepID=J3PAX8_GAET3|nr:hypothetical protein GGTG_10653 [Gaeumannomyces tritici R3-111a-1]EJT71394.1 hypothetical protein GGTG_10653 [Gaeumannomyces tritici R3-111a-1]
MAPPNESNPTRHAVIYTSPLPRHPPAAAPGPGPSKRAASGRTFLCTKSRDGGQAGAGGHVAGLEGVAEGLRARVMGELRWDGEHEVDRRQRPGGGGAAVLDEAVAGEQAALQAATNYLVINSRATHSNPPQAHEPKPDSANSAHGCHSGTVRQWREHKRVAGPWETYGAGARSRANREAGPAGHHPETSSSRAVSGRGIEIKPLLHANAVNMAPVQAVATTRQMAADGWGFQLARRGEGH